MWSKFASNSCWLWLAISALVLSACVESSNGEFRTVTGLVSRGSHSVISGVRTEESEELAPFLSWMFSHDVNTRSGNPWKGSSKLGSEFLGKRMRGSEFLGKRASEFLGKRVRGSEFLGKRVRGSEFLGKRASEFLGKRVRGSEFLGKRPSGSEFLGKRLRGSEFLGKRSAAALESAKSAPELPVAEQSDRDLFWNRFDAEDEDVMD